MLMKFQKMELEFEYVLYVTYSVRVCFRFEHVLSKNKR